MIRRAPLLRAGLLLLASLLATGCDRSSAEDRAQAAAPLALTVEGTTAGLLDRIVRAPFDVAYRGTRRVETSVPREGGAPLAFVTLESVAADGQGRFVVETTAVDAPSLSQETREALELLQNARQSFLYRYRDFRIRDLLLAGQSWTVRDTGSPRIVASRACVELEFRRRDETGSRYVAAVDPASGLVLAWSEHSLDGALISQVEFDELDLAPDLEGVAWAEPDREGRTLAADEDEADALGVAPARPRLLPAGFRAHERRVVSSAEARWFVRAYGDGIESFFFVHARPSQPPVALAAGLEPGSAVVRVYSLGAWTIAEHQRADGEVLMVIGKAAEVDLVRTLRSSL